MVDAFGLIATNTIGQGDTRCIGAGHQFSQKCGSIARATRRLKWPGEAAVVVSVVHISKGAVAEAILDTQPVRRISAYLVEGDLDGSPQLLVASAGKAFQGSIVLGMGFTFDDQAASKGTATSLADMGRLLESHPHYQERIFPYLGGEELNNNPRQEHSRYVIDFESNVRGGSAKRLAGTRRYPGEICKERESVTEKGGPASPLVAICVQKEWPLRGYSKAS